MTDRAVTINQTLFMKTFIILSKNTTKIKQHNGLWHDMACRNFKSFKFESFFYIYTTNVGVHTLFIANL